MNMTLTLAEKLELIPAPTITDMAILITVGLPIALLCAYSQRMLESDLERLLWAYFGAFLMALNLTISIFIIK